MGEHAALTAETRGETALRHAVDQLRSQANVVLVRQPLLDPLSPTTSDLDLLAFGPVEALLTERLRLCPGAGAEPMPRVDVIWLPASLLHDPVRLAEYGLITHRLLSSKLCFDADGEAAGRCDEVGRLAFRPAHQRARVAGYLGMGYSAVREIGVTWDVPSLCLFWLHIAHASCVATLLDASGALCPNVYTRPLDYWAAVERATDVALELELPAALRLDVDPRGLVEPLRRMHALVLRRFPEPPWPPNMRQDTRSEYRYFLDPEELQWRLAVAGEMAAHGRTRAAVHYLRFWAYALACIPLVHARAREGIRASFLRPQRAMGADLRRHCPELLADLCGVLGGADVSADEVRHGIEVLGGLRAQTLEALRARGLDLSGAPNWQPFETLPGMG